jgi:peptidoglycan hydrolase-like protein with peptidoglycan-binding domain
VEESPARPAPADERAPSVRPAPARAPRGQGIKNAQSALRQLGYDPGPLDNVYGRRTRAAILKFQRTQRLPVTGVLDRETWSAIVAQLMPRRPAP